MRSTSPINRIEPTLKAHWRSLTADLNRALGYSIEELQVLGKQVDGEHLIAEFVGSACEWTERNFGKTSPVVSIATLDPNLHAWLGYYEEWVKRGRSFEFRSVGLTVFAGAPFSLAKSQVFRAEWPGISDWAGGRVGFQAEGAAHPHWQFDALETWTLNRQRLERDANARLLAQSIEGEEPTPKDFTAQENSAARVLEQLNIQRIHFASAARWWEKPVAGDTVFCHAPASEQHLRSWVLGCLEYVVSELDRLRR